MMTALVPFALAGWLGAWAGGGMAGGSLPYRFVNDNGEPFALRQPVVDLTPAHLPAGLLLLPTPPPLRSTSEGIPPMEGIAMPDAVINTVLLVGGAALLTSVVLNFLK